MTQTAHLPGAGVHAGTATMGPADIWRILRKRIFLVVACFIVFGLGGTAALVAWRVWAPFYTAEGIVEVESAQGGGMVGLEGGTVVPITLYQEYMTAQAMGIKRYTVLDAALQKLGPSQTMYGGADAAYKLGQDLAVAYLPKTQDISVSLMGRDASQLATIVNAVLDEFITNIEDDRQRADAKRQADLRVEREQLRGQLEDLARQLGRLRDESGAIVLNEQGSEHLARLATLTQQLVLVQVQLAEAEVAWKQFEELHKQATEKGDLSLLLSAFPEVMAGLRLDQSVNGASQRYSLLDQDLQAKKARFGPQHESVRQGETAVQAAKNDVEQARNESISRLLQEQAGTLKGKYDRAREAEAQMLAKVTETREAATAVAKKAAEYREREQDYRRVQTLLDTVMNGLERLRIAAALTRSNIRVTVPAMTPFEHSQPRLALYIPAVLFLGLLIGVGLCLLLEFVDTRLRTPSEVTRQVGVPLLGSIPDLAEDERLSVDSIVPLVSHTAPQSLMAEAYRHFRTSLLFASDRPIKSLLVTSPSPGDGKTSAASNLAIAMARSGARILLVEANYRRPAVAKIFDIPDAVGLSNVLVGLNTPAEAIRATAIENLDVLPGGPPPPSPADLLGSDGMTRFLDEQSRNYDHIVIDGAPVLVVADIHLLAEAVDAVVLVFRAGENSRGLALRAARQVHSLRARLLGAVLNGVRATKGGYFREAYQAYYEYSGSATTCVTGIPSAGASRASVRRQETPDVSPKEGGAGPGSPSS